MKLVAHSPAVQPRAMWAQLAPAQQLANSATLALLSWLVLVHGLCALGYGWFHFFLFDGFNDVNGMPALLLALGNLALSLAWGTHVWQRHVASATPARCQGARRGAYVAWALCWLVALAIWWLAPASSHRTFAIAGESDTLLTPLPWVWPWFVGLAKERVILVLGLTGVAALALLILCVKLEWGRGMMASLVLMAGLVGAWLIGDASYQYAASRGAMKAGSELRAAYLADPARFNAWLSVCWWSGWGALAGSAILAYTTLLVPAAALRGGVLRARRSSRMNRS